MGSKRRAKGSRLVMATDLASMAIAFILAACLRQGILSRANFFTQLYGSTMFILVLTYLVIYETGDSRINIFKRGFFDEFVSVFKDHFKLSLILVLYLFMIQQGGSYSRFFFLAFFILNFLLTYVLRSYLKLVMLVGFKRSSSSSKVMLITTYDKAAGIIRKIRGEYMWNSFLNSIAIVDGDHIGERIERIMVLANIDNLLEIARLNVVDAVFIHLPYDYEFELEETILELEKMGIIVHLNIDINPKINAREKRLNLFAGHQVITFATSMFDERAEILKRLLDFAGGLIGAVLTLLVTLFLAPLIKLESKGPVFFSQMRIGKNGRQFKIYKFRSMYDDAEDRKKELMEKNEMQGLMFKMKDDPRITKIGKFIRKTSLDEFPQFFNVLRGDMSLVGTRPPTLDEFEQYEIRHKRRLSLKPGLTGLWQVSGRSDIEDFEEVVRLDLQYIDNWSIGLDVKLIVKTVGVMVFGRGGR